MTETIIPCDPDEAPCKSYVALNAGAAGAIRATAAGAARLRAENQRLRAALKNSAAAMSRYLSHAVSNADSYRELQAALDECRRIDAARDDQQQAPETK